MQMRLSSYSREGTDVSGNRTRKLTAKCKISGADEQSGAVKKKVKETLKHKVTACSKFWKPSYI